MNLWGKLMFYHAAHKQSALLFKKTDKPLKYIHGPSFYLFLIFTFGFWNNAQAEWMKYARSSNGDIHYFEQTNVNKNSTSIIIRNRVRYYASLMGAKSYESLLLINCNYQLEKMWCRIFQPNFRPNQKKPVRSNPNFLDAALPESVVKDSLDVARNIIKDA